MTTPAQRFARQAREQEAADRARDRQRETFDVHASGRAQLAHPRMVGGVGGASAPPAVTVVNETNVNAGQHVELTATGDSIASGGDYIAFDTIADQHGFGGVTAAGASITLPDTACELDVHLELDWDSYLYGGTVALELDGTIVHTFGGATAVAAFGWEGGWPIRQTGGQVLKVKVTQSSGSAQTLDARVRVTLHDPTSPELAAGLEEPGPDLTASDLTHGASMTVTFPAATAAGDRLLVGLISYDAVDAAATGWTLVGRDGVMQVLTKVATASDVSAGSVTFTGPSLHPTYGCVRIPSGYTVSDSHIYAFANGESSKTLTVTRPHGSELPLIMFGMAVAGASGTFGRSANLPTGFVSLGTWNYSSSKYQGRASWLENPAGGSHAQSFSGAKSSDNRLGAALIALGI